MSDARRCGSSSHLQSLSQHTEMQHVCVCVWWGDAGITSISMKLHCRRMRKWKMLKLSQGEQALEEDAIHGRSAVNFLTQIGKHPLPWLDWFLLSFFLLSGVISRGGLILSGQPSGNNTGDFYWGLEVNWNSFTVSEWKFVSLDFKMWSTSWIPYLILW